MSVAPLLPREVVVEVIAALSPENGAFLVGGQALNFWADYFLEYSTELQALAPFTSKDIDFQGTKEAAIQLAEMFGGTVVVPKGEHATPNSAVVTIEINGIKVTIDFLNSVVGLDPLKEKYVVDFEVPISLDNGECKTFVIGIHHPFACMVTRVTNICYLKRSDDMAYKQLQIAPVVLKCYLDKLIDLYGNCAELNIILTKLHIFLRRNVYGRKVHLFSQSDPLCVLESYRFDERLDERFRRHQIATWVEDIKIMRSNLRC